MNAKENFLETIRWGKPERLVNEWETLGLVMDPFFLHLYAGPGMTKVDDWGVTLSWGENEPGAVPMNDGDLKVCPDITQWKKYVKAPDLDKIAAGADWAAVDAQIAAVKESGRLVMAGMFTGLFEQSHFLMGFEDTLCNMMTEQEHMHELYDYLLEYKLKYAKLLVEHIHPEIMLVHDDWGTKYNLFMSPEIWRTFFKDRYAKIAKYLHDNGIIVMHHADSHCELVTDDMAEIGIDIWQGVLAQNDIAKIQSRVKGRMTLMGGIDSAIVDCPNWDEQTVRREVRRVCETFGPAGGFIPCLPNGLEGSIFPGVNDVIMDEIRAYNAAVCAV